MKCLIAVLKDVEAGAITPIATLVADRPHVFLQVRT